MLKVEVVWILRAGGGDASAGSQIFFDVFHARFGYPYGDVGSIVFTGLAAISLFFGNITNVTLTARMVSRSDYLSFLNEPTKTCPAP